LYLLELAEEKPIYSISGTNERLVINQSEYFKPYRQAALNNSLLNVFNEGFEIESDEGEGLQDPLLKGSTITLYDINGPINTRITDKTYHQSEICGTYYCLLSGDRLEVYENFNENNSIFEIYGVQQFQIMMDTIYLSTLKGVVGLDLNTLEGYYLTESINQGYCGLKVSNEQLIECSTIGTNDIVSVISTEKKDRRNNTVNQLRNTLNEELISSVDIGNNVIFLGFNIDQLEDLGGDSRFGYSQEIANKDLQEARDIVTRTGIRNRGYVITSSSGVITPLE
jgi:hypothetical protein